MFGFFRDLFGPPWGPKWAQNVPLGPAFEPQSIVQIRQMATRLVAKNCFHNFRNSRNSFSARCISAYSECRNMQKKNWHYSAKNQGPKPRFSEFCALGGAQGIKTPKTLVPSFFWFQKRKIATKGVFRARICVSTPELAMVFRGESVSGHPGARGGQKNTENHPENFQNM